MQRFVREISLLFVILTLAACQGYDTLWPIPQEYVGQPTGDAVKISNEFAVVTNQPSQTLNRAVQRYKSIIMQRDLGSREYFQVCSNSTTVISKLSVNVASRDETLDIDTSYEYTLTVEDGKASISASTIYGAM